MFDTVFSYKKYNPTTKYNVLICKTNEYVFNEERTSIKSMKYKQHDFYA